jgi:hypothetical protein
VVKREVFDLARFGSSDKDVLGELIAGCNRRIIGAKRVRRDENGSLEKN